VLLSGGFVNLVSCVTMAQLDLSFFLEPPDLTTLGILHIEPLAPLSLVVAQPGVYYRSQAAPSENMLYGMLENALGWHFDEDAKIGLKRKSLLPSLKKAARKLQGRKSGWLDSEWLNKKHQPSESGVGAWSLLGYHLRFEPPHVLPAVERYEDLWTQHLHDKGSNFFRGSRVYDYSLEPLVTRTKAEDPRQALNPKTKKRPSFIEMGEGENKGFVTLDLETALQLERGKLHYNSVRSKFPQYYGAPKKREYVIPQGTYRFRVKTTGTVSGIIREALQEPQAPLYLGTNDGWVEAHWEVL
jgi:hypothetical protein